MGDGVRADDADGTSHKGNKRKENVLFRKKEPKNS
jgi:hypothetical protein